MVFTTIITLIALNVRELQSGDETRVAGIAAEMFVEKDYLLPRLNGSPFLEYPPLYYWCATLSYSLFGINDFAAKLPATLAALGCGLLIFFFGKKNEICSVEHIALLHYADDQCPVFWQQPQMYGGYGIGILYPACGHQLLCLGCFGKITL